MVQTVAEEIIYEPLFDDDVKPVELGINKVDGLPSVSYFLPAVVFIILLYFALVNVDLPTGYVSALFGVALINLLFQTIFVGYGVITGEWFEMEARANNLFGQVIIGIIGFVSSQVTFYVIRLNDSIVPDMETIVWFVYGFIVYQFMLIVFIWIYKNRAINIDLRANIILSMMCAVIVGIIPIYAVMVV